MGPGQEVDAAAAVLKFLIVLPLNWYLISEVQWDNGVCTGACDPTSCFPWLDMDAKMVEVRCMQPRHLGTGLGGSCPHDDQWMTR